MIRLSVRPLSALAGGLVLAAVAAGCGGSPTGSADAALSRTDTPEEQAIAVQVAPVRREAISALYSTSTTLRADRQAQVTARTRGVIRRLEAEEGYRVAAEQPLARLEDDEQRIAAASARVAHDTARRELERQQGLLEQGLVSADLHDQARRAAEEAGHALELAELTLARTVIRAPFAGLVVRRHLDVGATVSDGTPVFDLADVDPLYADVNVPERHVTRLQPGQQVLLTADATKTEATARIERVAPAVDTATGTVKVTVAVEGGATLRPGAFVRVDIVTDTRPDALVVSRSALVAEGRRWILYRLASDRATVRQLEAQLGFESGDRVEIAGVAGSETALQAGEEVVVVGAPALSDGAAVRVVGGDA